MTRNHLPGGVLTPLVTPLTAEGRLDEAALERLVEGFASRGAGFFLLGTTAEGASMEEEMRRTVVARAVAVAAHRAPVYAGISDSTVATSLRQAERWAELGADGVFAHVAPYYPLSEWEIERYFERLADAVSLPLVLYNIPQTTNLSLPLELIDRLSRHPRIVGLKDSERGAERLDRALELWAARDDFAFLVGWAARSAYGALRGAHGLVPGSANLVPELYSGILDAARRGHAGEADRLQALTDEVSACYQEGRVLSQQLAALKYLMHLRGHCTPAMLPPIGELPLAERAAVRERFEALERRAALVPAVTDA